MMASSKTKISLADARNCVDMGILTMKPQEFGAVLRRFPTDFEAHGKLQYNICRFSDAYRQVHYAAIVRTNEQGDIPAQSTARSLIDDLMPNLVVLVGIAGAKPEVEFTLGDVIVANRMYDFMLTAANPGGLIEHAVHSAAAHRVAQIVAANLEADAEKYGYWNSEAAIGMARPPVRLSARNFAGSKHWKRKVREALDHYFGKEGHDRQPIVFDGAIGSASTLMKDPMVFEKWLTMARDLKAVDMEISGVCEAARSIEGDVPVIVIRGLSDIVGFKRDNEWTEYACNSAASFCRALAQAGVVQIGQNSERNLDEPNVTLPTLPQPLPLPDKPSIVVLPFQNMSDAKNLADIVVINIGDALSHIKSLFVIAGFSSFGYKDRVDVKQVGRELGVRYLLQGMVHKAGSVVRIAGELMSWTRL